MEGKHKNDDLIVPLMEKYGLVEDVDVFTKRTKSGQLIYRIINRKGIDKIAAIEAENLDIDWDLLPNSDATHIYLRFKGHVNLKDGGRDVVTSGEASEENVQQEPKYLLAMAEARGRSRCILKLLGFYELGVYSEDEADEFKDFVRKGSAPITDAPARRVSSEEIPDFLRG